MFEKAYYIYIYIYIEDNFKSSCPLMPVGKGEENLSL